MLMMVIDGDVCDYDVTDGGDGGGGGCNGSDRWWLLW